MDGLDVVRPFGDPALTSLRNGPLSVDKTAAEMDLDGFFALHPRLAPLMPLWQAEELAFAHAVATPYRNKRSHFDGQDLLEAGTGYRSGERIARDGWLNRMMQTVPGIEAETAFAIGREDLLVLRGDAPVANWAPGTTFDLSPQAQLLLERVYTRDPLFSNALAETRDLLERVAEDPANEGMVGAIAGRAVESKHRKGHQQVAEFAALQLCGDTRIAAFSINGWDTHKSQQAAIGGALGRLSDTILSLKEGLGPIWGQTVVLAMTEFGRTVRQNGTLGTDHGTGGAMLLAGGAIRGRRVFGNWPGLEEADLYQRRDLMPTADVRQYAAVVMQGLFGLPRSALETAVFPGLDMPAVQPVLR
jgi:uncharacterized protein (DUF1501 family)